MTRRVHGSVYQRSGDGRWVATLPVRDNFTGRKRPITQYAHPNTKEAAEVLLAKMLTEQRQGTLITESMHFDVFAKRWLEEVKKPSVTESTYHTYQTWWNAHIAPYFKTMPLRDITPQVVHDWQHKLQQRRGKDKLSDSYIRSLKTLLGQCFRQAEAWRLVARNPVAVVKAPRKGSGPHKIQVWTPDEATRFLAHMRGHELEPMYATALMLGPRLGELLGLRWCDIDFDAGVLTISGQWSQLRCRTDTKTHQQRRIDMPRSLVTLLRAYKQRRAWEGRLVGKQWQEDAYLFAWQPTGLPPTHSTAERWFKRDSAAAKVTVSTFHLTRHTAASIMHSKGVPIITISKVLGHSNPNITAQIYTHIFAQSFREAADVMDDLLGGVGG